MNKYTLDSSVVTGSLLGFSVFTLVLDGIANTLVIAKFDIAVLSTIMMMSYYFYLSFVSTDSRQIDILGYIAMLTFCFIGLSVITYIASMI